ncbi:hypothetical protein EYF80_020070 [Liparis tanakae]|uniref:Uncharacterized protein n=1 Tax=Liparis tanakae TaxID=230148 RepID=A0A4Z2HV40_9TELE|nr:hypothetical protein EYF80_020070 [Liparis tanakae]
MSRKVVKPAVFWLERIHLGKRTHADSCELLLSPASQLQVSGGDEVSFTLYLPSFIPDAQTQINEHISLVTQAALILCCDTPVAPCHVLLDHALASHMDRPPCLETSDSIWSSTQRAGHRIPAEVGLLRGRGHRGVATEAGLRLESCPELQMNTVHPRAVCLHRAATPGCYTELLHRAATPGCYTGLLHRLLPAAPNEPLSAYLR